MNIKELVMETPSGQLIKRAGNTVGGTLEYWMGQGMLSQWEIGIYTAYGQNGNMAAEIELTSEGQVILKAQYAYMEE